MMHAIEADKSWALHLERQENRRLKKRHHHHPNGDDLERQKEREYWEQQEKDEKEKEGRERDTFENLYDDPGISYKKVHGMMIDAGSSGSRIHLYEWVPRILFDTQDIEAAVSGRKLSYPGTETRWTNRIEPGIDSFANLPDDEILPAVADYLFQFLDFAKTILHDQLEDWAAFPIFLRATGGMRIVSTKKRARLMRVVRTLFSNDTYCPFAFVDEQARVISG